MAERPGLLTANAVRRECRKGSIASFPALRQPGYLALVGVERMTARSTLPSPLKSPVTTRSAVRRPGRMRHERSRNVPSRRSPRKDAQRARLEGRQTNARSVFPSPLKSPSAIDCIAPGPLRLTSLPAPSRNVPSPFPRKTFAAKKSLLVNSMTSGFPSPLKSPAATEIGEPELSCNYHSAGFSPNEGCPTTVSVTTDELLGA